MRAVTHDMAYVVIVIHVIRKRAEVVSYHIR
jgi:hypothetical protein